ncbi:uncharacterized protein V6R79_002022 [Siganus canaliculatus]
MVEQLQLQEELQLLTVNEQPLGKHDKLTRYQALVSIARFTSVSRSDSNQRVRTGAGDSHWRHRKTPPRGRETGSDSGACSSCRFDIFWDVYHRCLDGEEGDCQGHKSSVSRLSLKSKTSYTTSRSSSCGKHSSFLCISDNRSARYNFFFFFFFQKERDTWKQLANELIQLTAVSQRSAKVLDAAVKQNNILQDSQFKARKINVLSQWLIM